MTQPRGVTQPPGLPPLLSVSIDPRARLALFDIADDPAYVAMEVQAFDDDVHGKGLLVLLARHDGRIDVHHEPGLRLDRRPFAIGRGIGEWRETRVDPAVLETAPDGLRLEVGLEDAAGRRIEATIDDRDGRPRRRSVLLAPVSSGVDAPEQLLVVLMRGFDLGRTSGRPPRLVIDGVERTVRPFPGPAWLHHRRFIRSSAAPVIVSVHPAVDGPVDPASLGPIGLLSAASATAEASLRFEPPVPALGSLPAGGAAGGTWRLDVTEAPSLTGGTWSARRDGDEAVLELAVTQPWRPRGLPLSLRLVTTVARVFRDWPTTYAYRATVRLDTDPPRATAGWTRLQPPDRGNAYGLRVTSVGRAGAILGAAAAAVVLVRAVVRRLARR